MKFVENVIIPAILKKGFLYEARNIDTEIEVPMEVENQEHKIRISIKCEHMTLRIEKDDQEA